MVDTIVKIWNVNYGQNVTSEWLVAPSLRAALDKAEARIEKWVVEGREDRAIELLSKEQIDAEEAKDWPNPLWPLLTPKQQQEDEKEVRDLYHISKIELAGETDA